jgi:6-phosphogluconolactonase
MAEVIVCSDPEMLARRAAAAVEEEIAGARQARRIAHVALSGGTTPVRTYELLAASPLDWTAVELWFADERCVGPADPESNYRLLAESLVEPAAIGPERVHRMAGELGPAEGARRYAELLASRLREGASGVPVLDLVLLGIGPEGHIASLFPGTRALAGDEATEGPACLGIHDSPKPPPERITLSLPVLRAARRCLLLASGRGKAEALARALGPPSAAAPASLLPGERLTILADADAASLLPRERSRGRS